MAFSSIPASVSTDDWPFFYMPQRVYPLSYLVMIFQILVLSVGLGAVVLHGREERIQFNQAPFLFLGVGFMLLETKGITEMGLTFGNTWQVIGIVIASILTMACLSTWVVSRFRIRRTFPPFVLLGLTLATGWYVSRMGGFASTAIGRLETAVVLTCPLLFSGLVFSTLLTGRGQLSGILAMNLLGGIIGGLLEYNSMYFGFRSLYIFALAAYALAFVGSLESKRASVIAFVNRF